MVAVSKINALVTSLVGFQHSSKDSCAIFGCTDSLCEVMNNPCSSSQLCHWKEKSSHAAVLASYMNRDHTRRHHGVTKSIAPYTGNTCASTGSYCKSSSHISRIRSFMMFLSKDYFIVLIIFQRSLVPKNSCP